MYRPNARPDGHHLSFLINTQVFERVKLNESWIRISTMVDPTSICHTFGSLHRNQLKEKCAISVGKLTATHFVYSNFTPAIFVFTSFIIFSLFFFSFSPPSSFSWHFVWNFVKLIECNCTPEQPVWPSLVLAIRWFSHFNSRKIVAVWIWKGKMTKSNPSN